MLKRIILLTTLAIILALAGCVTTPTAPQVPTPTTPSMSWQERQAALQKIIHWQIRGSMSIRQVQRNQIVNVNWLQNGANYKIDLAGPLHLGAVTITGGPNGVTLYKSANEVYTADTPEELIAERTGWQIPVSDLYYWVRGIPAPGATHLTFDSNNRLTQFKQHGWSVQYLNYQNTQGADLPRLIQFSQGNTIVRLAIKQWQIH